MNNDLISRSELAEVVAKKINNPAIKSWLFAIINEIPTADTERRGEWIPCDYAYYHCSECALKNKECSGNYFDDLSCIFGIKKWLESEVTDNA